jgi:putative membrane protein
MEVDPDSRARTHLANERTFLAWLRTGITLIALGLAAAQFLARDVLPEIPVVRTLATLMILMGVFTICTGLYRYRKGAERIEAEEFRPAGSSLVIATALALAISVLSIGFVWILHRG